MEEARSAQDIRDAVRAQALIDGRPLAPIVRLLDMREITRGWGKSNRAIYRAVNEGRLRRFGRPGRQSYYALDEVVAVFGDPSSDFGLLGSKLRFPLFVWGGLDEAA